jgi:centrosomal protein CEP89
MLEKINHRITSELSAYQAKYPSKSVKLKMKEKLRELSGLPAEGPIPSWTINLKMLSPLIAAYDDRLNEKDEFIRKLQTKLEQLGQRFEELAEENLELHSTLEKIPHHLIPKDSNAQKNARLSEWEQIKRHAQLVLEENQVLKEQIQLIHQRFVETQNINIAESKLEFK